MSNLSHMNDQSFATWRSVLIGALLIPLNSYWHIQMTLVWLMNFPAILTLLFNVIFFYCSWLPVTGCGPSIRPTTP
ncbi:TPA: hypothetical protein EYO63_07755 [Candidatus Poribacteria bacterium]|nr:hypothetical protein [Candidatus Poribacteria bacterium]